MSLWSRLKSVRRRWWVIAGVPAALVLFALLFLTVRWVQYRAYQNVDLVAILPDDAQAAVRLPRMAERWPQLAKAPALVALARTKDPARGEGPLSLAEFAKLAGGDLPPGVSEERVLEIAGRDAAAAVVFAGGRKDVVAATRVPFWLFLAGPFIPMFSPEPTSRAPTGVVSIGAAPKPGEADLRQHYIFCGDILIAGTRLDWVETAAARADSGERGRAALELEAAAPEGEPAFWLDVAGARKDPKFGPELKEWFNAIPVREALFMLDLEATRAVSGRLVVEGAQARLEGTVLLSSRLGDRLERMYAMPPGDAGLLAMLPASTCYATGARVESETSWDFLRDLTKPSKAGGKRKTVSAGFGDFVENIYLYLHDGLRSAEDHKSDLIFKSLADRDVTLAMTSEKAEPFLGVTILARVTNGDAMMEALFKYFEWLYEEENEKDRAFVLKSDEYRKLDVRVLEGKYDVLGTGVKPAFTVIGNVLVVSSSYDTLKAIADVKLGGEPGFLAEPVAKALQGSAPADGAAWAYADVGAFRETLLALRQVAAKTQVARDLERQGTAKVRAKLTARYRKAWEERNPGVPWVDAEHVTAIDDAYRAHVAEEEARAARELEEFASRLGRIGGLAFAVRPGKGETLEWRAVLQALE
ncbi:MAG: hypothetical protein HYY18_13225 [Planctomycetes bacterium]|nr:hypothetical protein [Planctomycetota bacterium]